MKFEQFLKQKQSTLVFDDAGELIKRYDYDKTDAKSLPPLILAYMGDAWFDLFVRTKLLSFEQSKVRILHDFDAAIVSATMQSLALHALERELTEIEQSVVRRGRNAKSTVPKSATVRDYRASTGFEALLGYLYITKQFDRLTEMG
ncbi:MAG: ribonuclease III domain-containing protein, partial [Sporomusaceae bacterium]|nr:ribonuclease III domain-containing protein [Sporomusaceae bacterium]